MNKTLSLNFIDSITIGISDSFVENSNKTGTGNGEAKLYVGQDGSPEFSHFFGPRGFRLMGRLHKSDLIRFMNEVKPFYFQPLFNYRAGNQLKSKWHERMKQVSQLTSNVIEFEVVDQTQIDPPRCYVKSSHKGFKFLRSLPLSHIAKLIIVKYDSDKGHLYDFKLVIDIPQTPSNELSGYAEEILTAVQSGQEIDVGREIARIRKERIGQEKFRAGVLKDCSETCPFTNIKDGRLLIAGHIKPWAKSTGVERVDPQNGLALTPTFDKLFNDGYISFTDDGNLIISPLLSLVTRNRLRIRDKQPISIPIKGPKNLNRRRYLEYHRQEVLRT